MRMIAFVFPVRTSYLHEHLSPFSMITLNTNIAVMFDKSYVLNTLAFQRESWIEYLRGAQSVARVQFVLLSIFLFFFVFFFPFFWSLKCDSNRECLDHFWLKKRNIQLSTAANGGSENHWAPVKVKQRLHLCHHLRVFSFMILSTDPAEEAS